MIRLLHSEIRKVLTLKLWWALGITPLIVGLFASVITVPAFSAAEIGSATEQALGAGMIGITVSFAFIFLFSGLFGAINSATEFRHKTITTTVLVSSGRDLVVSTKLIITAGVGLLYALLLESVTVVFIFIVAAVNGDNGEFALTSDIIFILLAGALATVLWSLMGAGLGLLLGSTVGSAISIVV
ncbi:MAG: ABC transporter permease, partial [Mycobacteriaceae bacterium]